MKDYKKISKITLLALMGVGILASILFFAGGSNGSLEVAGDFLPIPKFTTLFLAWNYVLVVLVCLVTLAVVVWEFVKTYKVDPKKAMAGLGVFIGFIALIVVCWLLGSPEKIDIVGYEGSDNQGAMARMSDACLYLTYFLVLGTIAAMVWGLVYTRKK